MMIELYYEKHRVDLPTRELNHYQHMDQSLRTVATQLLNVSGSNDMVNIKENQEAEPSLVLLVQQPDEKNSQKSEEIIRNDTNKLNEDNKMEIVKTNNSEILSSDNSHTRPVNSKYHYTHFGHPGQAMALTDEELEIELSDTKTTSLFNRKSPSTTTAGGISTWVQVNPPKTTPKPFDKKQENNIPASGILNEEQTTIFPFKISNNHQDKIETTLKKDVVKPSTTVIPIEQITQKTVVKKLPTIKSESTTTVDSIMTSRAELYSTEKPLELSATVKTITTTTINAHELNKNDKKTSSSSSTSRNSSKPRSTTPKSAAVTKTTTMKIAKPTPSRTTKPSIIRKQSNKNDVNNKNLNSQIYNATSKIEKVTFKPISMITTPKSQIESVPNAVFTKKIQANFNIDSNKNLPSTINDSQIDENLNSTSTFTDNINKSKITKPNNNISSKIQFKKPIDTPTTIEIEPIKVNAPILRIEKIEERKKASHSTNKDHIKLNNSHVDGKLNLKSELTKIETSTSPSTTTTTATSTTTSTTSETPTSSTKKPKRKKNKTRRRKPSSSSSSSTTTTTESTESDPLGIGSVSELFQEIADSVASSVTPTDNTIQESKVVPDVNDKNKKKQVAKPFGTQIYNYLSKEVMPSFGVMSLVGLGLGLASYFLYPFGGVIARRNDIVHQNYKYTNNNNNMDEYSGNFGQNEEEIFSKVLQGMTPNDDKFISSKDYVNNPYRYQTYDGAYGDSYTTIKNEQKYTTSSAVSNTKLHDLKYKNTEFKYPELTTIQNYYDTNKKQNNDYNKNHRNDNYNNNDRKFVVGNIPKEYTNNNNNDDDDNVNNKNRRIIATTESIPTDFEKQIAQSLKFLKNPLEEKIIEQPNAQPLTINNDDNNYDDSVNQPAAVAVEHGPRSLNIDDFIYHRNDEQVKIRAKRESVIQMIPTRSEKDEHEDDFNNEILDIIDTALPSDMNNMNTDKPDVKIDMKTSTTTTDKPREELTTTTTTNKIISKTKEYEVEENSNIDVTTVENKIDSSTQSTTNYPTKATEKITTSRIPTTSTSTPIEDGLNAFNFVKKIAEVKFRIGLSILKHASENFAKYLGNVQKRINGEE
ncbi:hypothetical protein HCN44_001756 [Aphidius gifuensis]|uniref:Uncharacterized protein n=1 Tax=Aphidius gifuensis TaxID=684658 RepID=A0A834XX57_APHGI|nr:hypothetical protein HCN44_001756 [Aphidius gifuensis]